MIDNYNNKKIISPSRSRYFSWFITSLNVCFVKEFCTFDDGSSFSENNLSNVQEVVGGKIFFASKFLPSQIGRWNDFAGIHLGCRPWSMFVLSWVTGSIPSMLSNLCCIHKQIQSTSEKELKGGDESSIPFSCDPCMP